MKKLCLLLIFILVVAACTAVASDVTVTIDGEQIAFDTPPTIINGRTLVPMRKIFETLGMEVIWNSETRSVIAENDENKIQLQIDNYEMASNGEKIALDVAPTIINDRTLVPVRAVSSASGCTVDWDGNTRTVIINRIKEETPENTAFETLSVDDYFSPFYSGYINAFVTASNKIETYPRPTDDYIRSENFKNAVSINGDPGIMTIVTTDGKVIACVDPSYDVANYSYDDNPRPEIYVALPVEKTNEVKLSVDRGGTGFIYAGETINGMENIVYATSGKSHVIALKNDGTVWTWGYNKFGQLGNDSTEDSYKTAVEVKDLKNIVYVEANNNASYAVDKDGYVYAWGRLSTYNLGAEHAEDSSVPTKIEGLSNIKKIVSSGRMSTNLGLYCLAVDNSNNVFAWGKIAGKDYKTPVHLQMFDNVKEVACSSRQILILKNDGTLWVTKTEDLFSGGEMYQLNGSENKNILYIKAYDNALYFLSDNGHIYGYIQNSRNQKFVGTLDYDDSPEYHNLYSEPIDTTTPTGIVALPKK